MELRSLALGELPELVGMERIPKARRAIMRKKHKMIIPKRIVNEFDLRDGARECLPFEAIAFELRRSIETK